MSKPLINVDFSTALRVIAQNTHSAAAIALDGSIKELVPMEYLPSFEELKAITSRHKDCIVHIFDHEKMELAKLQTIVDQSVRALKLARSQKLRPGANLVDKHGHIEWAHDAARRRLQRHRQ